MSICIFGAGYVGCSLGVLFSQKYKVNLIDIDKNKVEKINNNICPIEDQYCKDFFKNKNLNIEGYLNFNDIKDNIDLIIFALPTDYDEKLKMFNTSILDDTIEDVIRRDNKIPILIKSTVPIGYTDAVSNKYNKKNIFFSPEFLRETKALFDNLYPSRIIVGYNKKHDEQKSTAWKIGNLLKSFSLVPDVKILITGNEEAESIKLFSNTYLAMRVAFFNELDTFAYSNNLCTKDIIDGVCLDKRIGDFYNNPSFGYGGYCLPKDSRQLKANFKTIPNDIISAVVKSNYTRKLFVVDEVLKKVNRKSDFIVGVYRLIMKSNSENFRTSAILDIINQLKIKNVNVIIFEPNLKDSKFNGCEVITNFNEFKLKSNLILANRLSDELTDIKSKVFTFDLYNRD